MSGCLPRVRIPPKSQGASREPEGVLTLPVRRNRRRAGSGTVGSKKAEPASTRMRGPSMSCHVRSTIPFT